VGLNSTYSDEIINIITRSQRSCDSIKVIGKPETDKGTLNEAHLRQLVLNCKNVEAILLNDSPNISDEVCRDIAKSCNNLVYLDISSSKITDATLEELSERCPSLCNIFLRHCDNITSNSIIKLSKTNRKLRTLDVIMVQLSLEAMESVACHCTALESFYAGSFEKQCITDEIVSQLTSNCKLLIDFTILYQDITDTACVYISERLPNLKVLNLPGCRHVGDGSLLALAKTCHNLEQFLLSGNTSVTDVGCIALVKANPKLKVMSLSMCINLTDEFIKELCLHAPDLQELHVSVCPHLSNASLVEIRKLKKLKYLDCKQCIQMTTAAKEGFKADMPAVEALFESRDGDGMEFFVL
jgi:F-box and leucine-rich repeat protein GRR1